MLINQQVQMKVDQLNKFNDSRSKFNISTLTSNANKSYLQESVIKIRNGRIKTRSRSKKHKQ